MVTIGMVGTGVAVLMPHVSDWSNLLMACCSGSGARASVILVSLLECRLFVADSRLIACISMGDGMVAMVKNC